MKRWLFFKIGLKFQDSVIRLLLNVEMLQPALSKWLLEKIALLAIQAEDENDQFLQPSQGKLIIGVKWYPCHF